MPIRPTMLKKHGERYILMGGDQTLGDALQRLREENYRENQAYLLVARSDQRYQASLFLELKRDVEMMGYDTFTQPLQALPLPFADRVVRTDTSESGQVILDWVACNPQSTLVVVDEGNQVAGLLANPNRSGGTGWLEKLSLLELHGELVDLGADARASFEAQVEPPTCPHCGSSTFFKFDPRQRIYVCPECKKTVNQI